MALVSEHCVVVMINKSVRFFVHKTKTPTIEIAGVKPLKNTMYELQYKNK